MILTFGLDLYDAKAFSCALILAGKRSVFGHISYAFLSNIQICFFFTSIPYLFHFFVR